MSKAFEIEIVARGADGQEHRRYAEYKADGDTPNDATHEVLLGAEKNWGRDRVKEIDPNR